jgi:hypothetical protein
VTAKARPNRWAAPVTRARGNSISAMAMFYHRIKGIGNQGIVNGKEEIINLNE